MKIYLIVDIKSAVEVELTFPNIATDGGFFFLFFSFKIKKYVFLF